MKSHPHGKRKSVGKLSAAGGTSIQRPGRQVGDESDGRSAVSGQVLSILARDSQRSSLALFQPQVLDEDPRNERDAARNAQLAVQAFEMGVDGVGRHTQADRDGGFLLVLEHRRQDLRLALGQLTGPSSPNRSMDGIPTRVTC
jgi:hypothetical protein